MLCVGKVDEGRQQPCSAAQEGQGQGDAAGDACVGAVGFGSPPVLLLPSSLGNCVVHLALSHSLLKTTYAYRALPLLSQCL